MSIFRKSLEMKKQGAILNTWVTDGKVYILEKGNGLSRRLREICDMNYVDIDTVHVIHQEPPFFKFNKSNKN